MSIIGGIATGLVANAIDNNRQKKIFGQQKKLMGMQQNNQMALNKQMQEIQMQNWENTNYKAQMEQMKKAGLNVGMMYGGSGAGGATMGGGSGGSAGGAVAPSMEQGAAKLMGIGLESAMMESQMELIKAQTEETRAKTEKTKGVDTDLGKSPIENLNANTGNTEADTIVKGLQATGMEIENYIKNNSAEFEIEQAEYLSGKLSEEIKNLQITNYKDKKTAETAIEQAKANLASTYLKYEATKAGIKLTEEQTRKISVELAQGWEELGLKHDSNINQFNANKIKLLETKIYKALGEEGNKLIKRGQDIGLMENMGKILTGNTTRKNEKKK
jgi:hypothetical protein